MKDIPPLMIFTNMFPYGLAENFLEEELTHLSRHFREIVIVPNQLGEQHRKLPQGVTVDNSFAEQYSSSSFSNKWKRFLKGLSNKKTYQELRRDPSILFKPRHLKTLLYFVSQAEYYQKWLRKYLHEHPDFQEAIFYSYWLHVQALGISLTKSRAYPFLKQISRAHSMEIYPEDYKPSYIPFREITLPTINHIYTISEHGQKRLINDYSELIRNISTSRLGVKDPKFLNPENSSKTLSLVSTSFLVDEKRIELIIQALKILAEKKVFEKITWTHFGNGPLERKLKGMADRMLGSNIDWKFPGYLPTDKLIEYYKSHPIDLFINTSRTEGIPISIMEAEACGIPVIATDVGGVSEIVNDKVGRLLKSHPSADEVANAILLLAQDKSQLKNLRLNAKENWKEHYDGSKNFESFATAILKT